MKARVSSYITAIALLAVLGVGAGCSKAPNDAQITSDVQTKISADSALAGKQISVQAANGSVTLAGTVDSDDQRDAAARYAASAEGVKQVVNNLQVAPPAAEMTPPAPVQQPQPRIRLAKPRPSKPRTHVDEPSVSDNTPPPAPTPAPSPAPPPSTSPAATAMAPAPPPPPQKVTIPTGTTVAVRLVDTIDTETATAGQTFHATVESPIAVDGDVVIPVGYNVEGHVVDVKSAGKFAGQSLLVLQLDRISTGNKFYSVQTDQYKREGSSRGKNTAEKVGVGAGIGAIIGAIAGGGKGAAIGAAAGGGVGGGVQAATKGQQINLASETVLNFTLQAPLIVIPAKNPNEGRQKLDANQ